MAVIDFDTFKRSVELARLPDGLVPALHALWLEARGDWQGAHRIAQEVEDASGAWVHAYLHRKEGDRENASYWYGQAGQSFFAGSLDDEWEQITRALLRR